jgi:Ca2+-transporting ATPase
MLGWALTWAAVELGMLQRLLDTVSLTGKQWGVVLLLSLIAPTIVWVDKWVQVRRQNRNPLATATFGTTPVAAPNTNANATAA